MMVMAPQSAASIRREWDLQSPSDVDIPGERDQRYGPPPPKCSDDDYYYVMKAVTILAEVTKSIVD